MLFEQLARGIVELAVEIRGDVLCQALIVVSIEDAHVISIAWPGGQFPVIPLWTNCWRITSRARNKRFFTVPSGSPVTSTISS